MPTTILIVEDHAEVRQTLRDWLRIEYPACRILTAASGEEAMALVQSEPAELVIMDVGLPGIDGFEAVRQIRLTNATVCIVMLSFDDGTLYRAEAAAAGADAYVSKRRIHSDLLPAVRGLLGEPTSEKGAAADGPG